MDPLVAVPLVATVLLRATAAQLGACLPPRAAARLLTGASLVAAASCGFVLTVVAFDALAQVPAFAVRGGWSAAQVRGTGSLPAATGWPVAGVVVVLLAAAARRLLLVARDLAAAQLTCRALGPGAGGLVVLADDRPAAYALPGWTGRIVVSTAMLRALPATEQRVLLAHEGSHLRNRHHLHVQLTQLASAANPLLRPVERAVARAVERWADEDAAAEVGDRRTAARALARASLAGRGGAVVAGALAAVRVGAGDRVRALLEPAPRPHLALRAAVLVLTLATTLSAAGLARHTEVQYERARHQLSSSAAPGRG